MTEERAPYDVETLKQIASNDQRSQSEKERDLAIAKCAVYTANHWHFLTTRGLPADLVARLTSQFHEAYLNALLFAGVTVTLYAEDEE